MFERLFLLSNLENNDIVFLVNYTIKLKMIYKQLKITASLEGEKDFAENVIQIKAKNFYSKTIRIEHK